ncbi:unnamed protein product [Chrysoparadoxa australica]
MIPRTQVRKIISFRDDKWGLNQTPPARFDGDGLHGVDRIKGYRYPAPSNQQPPNYPADHGDKSVDIYDTNYYSRDVSRPPTTVYTAQRYAEALEANLAELPDPEGVRASSSQGNKNPAVLRYDPSGLRSAMSATWTEMDKALEKAQDNHNVHYAWEDKASAVEIIEDCKTKGLPPVPGVPYKWNEPALRRQAQW